MHFQQQAPKDWKTFKQRIFMGDVFILPPSKASLYLVQSLCHIFGRLNGYAISKDLHKQKDFDHMMQDFDKIRTRTLDPAFSMRLIGAVLNDFEGAAEDPLIADLLRPRLMAHEAHKNGLSPHSTYAHRDTWYANPQQQINVWIPLLDVNEGNSFSFFPDYFDRAIENSSNHFDYIKFKQKAGFQGNVEKIDLSLYPKPLDDIPKDSLAKPFAAVAGSLVLFSPSHLHQTVLNESGSSRFSVDFRVVSVDDMLIKDSGAPNVDNDSQGNAAIDYYEVYPKLCR
jgi:hypothetical protein